MDTNNRQNQSTQSFEAHDASRYSRHSGRYGSAARDGSDGSDNRDSRDGRTPQRATSSYAASRGRHAREDSLEQNTAFGTTKKPEGFVATWKNASHTWRWRAVLCVFLALLLMMMQPTGNALYRSWNASNGEMMGLAAAISVNSDQNSGEEMEEDASDLVPARLAQSESATMVAQGNNPWNYESGGKDPSKYNGKLTFHESTAEAPVLNWTTSDTTGYSNTTLTVDGYTVTVPANFPVTSSNGYITNEYKPPVEQPGNDITVGNMGATKWLLTSDKSVSFTGDTSSDPYKTGYWVWSLGYELSSWVGESSSYLSSRLLTTDSSNNLVAYYKMPSSPMLINFPITDSDEYAPSNGTTAARAYTRLTTDSSTETSFMKEQNASGVYYDNDLYPVFTQRSGYGVIFFAPQKGGGDEGEDIYIQSVVGGLKWSDSISSYYYAVDEDSQLNFAPAQFPGIAWEVTKLNVSTENGEDVYTPATNGGQGTYIIVQPSDDLETLTGAVTSDKFGSIVNPDNLSDPIVDPFYKGTGSKYYTANSTPHETQYVGLTPNYIVEYDFNGGVDTNGAHRWVDAYPLDFGTNIYTIGEDGEQKLYAPFKSDKGYGVLKSGDGLSKTDSDGTKYTFKGWALVPDATEVLSDSTGTDLSSISGLSDVFATVTSDGDTTTVLTRSVVFYAVWDEVEESSYTVNVSTDATDAAAVLTDGETKTTVNGTSSSYTLSADSKLTYASALAALNGKSSISSTATDKYASSVTNGDAAYVEWIAVDSSGNQITDETALAADLPETGATFKAIIHPAKYPITYAITNGTWANSIDGYDADTGNVVQKVEYGTTPTALVAGDTVISSSSDGFSNVTPNTSGATKYKKSDNSFKGTWSASIASVTGAATYTYTLKAVRDITFAVATGTGTTDVLGGVSAWSSSDSTTAAKVAQVFDGEAFSTATDSSGDPFTTPTGMVAATTNTPANGYSSYFKGTNQDVSNAKSGAWYVDFNNVDDRAVAETQSSDVTTQNRAKLPASNTVITQDATYTYAFKRVWTATFKAATSTSNVLGGVSAWASDNSNTADILAQVFNGDAFSAATYSGGATSVPTAPVAATKYSKTSGTPATSGGWYSGDTPSPSASTVSTPASETTLKADATYTYAFKRVYDITFKVGTGATWSDNATTDKTGQYFHGDTVTAPTGMKAVANTATAKYTKTSGGTSGSWDATPPNSATADGTYTYSFLPVYTVTFKAGTGVATLNGSSNVDIAVDLFSSEKLQSSSIPTGMTASDGYKKTDGTTKGAWDTTPDTTSNASDDVTYTYNYTPVYTVTLNIVNGYWSGSDNAAKTTQYFSGDTFTAPATTPGSSIGEGYVADSWYEGDSTSTTKVTTWPSTVTANATYTYKYKTTENTVTYTHQPRHADGATYKVADTDLTITVNNGDMTGGGTKNYGDTITIPDLSGATATGYTFKGWKITKDSTDVTNTIGVTWDSTDTSETHVKGGTFSMPNGEVNVYALWERNTFDVTWAFATLDSTRSDVNATLKLAGASVAGESGTVTQTAEYGVLESALSAPALDAYNSDYYSGALTWYTDQAHGTEWTDKTASITANITRYALPQDAKYTFTLTTVNGGFKVDGAVDSDNTFTSTNTYSYDTKTSDILSAEKITFIEPSDTTNYEPYENYAFDSYSWSNSKDAAASSTILGEGAGTTSRSFTKTYNEYIPVTFKIYGGTWKHPDGSSATEDALVYYVPSGETLSGKGVLTKNDSTTAYSIKGLPTDSANKAGYVTTGEWVASSDSETDATHKWGDGFTASSEVSSAVTCVYKFDEASLTYTVHVYYQVATQSDSTKVGKIGDYEQSGHDAASTTLTGTADYNSTVAYGSINGLSNLQLYLSGAHFETTPVSPAGATDGRVIITNATGSNSFTMDKTDNSKEVYLYFDRTPVSYKYEYTSGSVAQATAEKNSFDMSEKTNQRWGQEITLETPDLNAGYSFDGWYANGGSTKLAGGSSYTLNALTTTLSGTLSEGSYTATFEFTTSDNITTGVPSGWVNGDDGGLFVPRFMQGSTPLSASAGESGTQTGIAYQGKVATTTVDFGTTGNKKYEVEKWYYKVTDHKYDSEPASGVWTEIPSGGDPSSIEILQDGYVFTPKLKLIDYTVTYTAGDYGNPLLPVDNMTKFTVHYGDAVPAVALSGDNYGPDNVGTQTHAVRYTSDSIGTYYAPEVLAVNAAQYQVTVPSSASDTNMWKLNDGYTNNLVDGKVGGNLQYDYVWDLATYSFTFKNVKGSSVVNNSTDDSWTYSGTYNTGSSAAKSGALTWEDSVFAGLAENESGRSVISPTKAGYDFAGWKRGTSEEAEGSVIAAAGNDIKVKDAYYTNSVSLTTRPQYLWATWTGKSVKITYDRNLTGGTNSSINWGADETLVSAATAQSSDVTVGSKPLLDKVADLTTNTGQSGAFAPAGYTFLGWYTKADLSEPSSAIGDNTDAYEVVPDDDNAAANTLYAKWRANTYKVQWKDFDNHILTNKDVRNAGIDSSAPDNDEPYQQTFTYNVPGTLKAMEKFFTDSTLAATHNSGDNVLKGWSYNSTTIDASGTVSGTTLDDGATIRALTTTDEEVVTLSPVTGNKVTLTYNFNAGSDKVYSDSGEITEIASAWSQYGKQNAEFTLKPAVYRPGYTFAGWKIGETTYDLTEGHTTWTSGTTDATAYAQWTPQQRNLTVNFYKQDALGSANYTEDTTASKTIQNMFVTGQSVTAGTTDGLTNIKLNDQQFLGYKYNSSKGNATVTITADGNASINLYYDLKSYTLNYRYTPATGTVATTQPPVKTETVQFGSHTLPTIPTRNGANWPVGWEPADSKWHVMKPNGSGGTTDETIDGTSLTVGDEYADADGNIDIVLPWQTEHLTVTFLLSNETEYGTHGVSLGGDGKYAVKRIGDTDASDTYKGTLLYSYAPETLLHNINVGVSDEDYAAGYRFLGWTLATSDNSGGYAVSDALVDMSQGITDSITLVAKIGKINMVTWAPGAHSKSKFSTAQKITNATYMEGDVETTGERGPLVFASLANPFKWQDATLTLGNDDLVQSTDTKVINAGTAAGQPAGQPGWRFTGFTDEDGAQYASVEAITTTLTSEDQRKRSYTFTANWTETAQTVTFDSGVGAASPDTTVATLTGYTNKKVLSSDGITTAVVPAAPAAKTGYTFTGYYIGTFTDENGKTTNVKLAPGSTVTFPAVDTTLTAEWTHDDVTINYEVAGAGGSGTEGAHGASTGMGTVSTLTTGKIYADGSSAAPEAVEPYTSQALPNPGYKFVGWYEKSDWEANGTNGTKLTQWYDASLAKLKTDTTTGKTALTENYGLLTVQKQDGLYKAATYVAVFEPDPFTVSFENAVDADGAEMGTLVVPDGLNNQQVNLNGNATMGPNSANESITVTANYGYTTNDWSYVVQEEQLDADSKLVIVEKRSSSNIADPASVGITGNTVFTAEYTPDSAYLLFEANEPTGTTVTGSTAPISGLKSGTWVNLPACGFSVPGYTFDGWSTSKKAEDKISAVDGAEYGKFKLQGAQRVYALWKPDTIKITYNQNAPSGTTSATVTDQTQKYDSAVAGTPGEGDLNTIVATAYTRAGAANTVVPGAARHFTGWNTNAEGKGTTVKAGASIPTSLIPTDGSALALYAQWADTEYTVTFQPGEAAYVKSGQQNPEAKTVVYGDQVSLPDAAAVYERPDYYFVGWKITNQTDTLVDKHTSTVWKFRGTNQSTSSADVNDKVSNVVCTALWAPNPGITAKVNVTLKNMGNIPGTSDSQLAKFTGLTESAQPLKNQTYEELEGQTKWQADEYFTFKGWYAVGKGVSASPASAFGEKESTFKLSGVNGGSYADMTVKDIIQAYYTTSKPLSGNYPEYQGSTGVPEWWDNSGVGVYTDTYTNASTIDFTLWRWAELSKYKVKYHVNAPWGYDADATTDPKGNTMADQVLDVPGSGSATNRYTLETNTWTFPGYTFLGWQTKPTTGDVSAVQQSLSGSMAEGSRAVVNGAVLDGSANEPLLTATSTDYEVDLYAVWKPIDYTVKFVEKYYGDGLTASGASDTLLGEAKAGYTWGNAASGEDTATVKYNPTSVVAPTIYSSDRPDVTFAGWYTKKNGATAATPEGAQVTVGTDTVGNIITKANSGLNATDGTITLYAKWAVNGARVHYELGDADDTAANRSALPADKVQTWNDTAADYGAQIQVDTNKLTRLGYTADGWTGPGSSLSGWTNTDVQYTDGVLHGETAATVNFAKALAESDRTATLKPYFTEKTYTFTYDYTAPTGYTSQVNTTGKGTPGKNGSAEVTQVSNVGWDSGSLYSYFQTPPALEGYTFDGFEYRIDSDTTVDVPAGMTPAQLAAAIAKKTGGTATDSFGDNPTLYAKWVPATYTVKYDLAGGTWTGGADPTTTAIWTSNKADAGTATRTLVIPQSDLSKTGFYEPTWYVNAACTIPTGGLSTDATLADIAAAWHTANGTSDPLPSTVTLYAKWKEDTVKVIFTVSDTSNATIRTPDNGVNGTDYVMDEFQTQIVYNVGTSTGYINGDPLKGKLPSITAVAASGYKVSEWLDADGNTVSSTAAYQLSSPNDTSDPDNPRYKATTYEAQIAGNATVGVTLRVYVQDTDGVLHTDTPTSTYELKASDFGKGLGDTLIGAEMDAKVQEKAGEAAMKGLTFDASRTASFEVSSDANQNVANLYYNRAKYDLTFAAAYESGEPDVPATLPDKQTLYVGQTSADFGTPAAPEGYTFDGWYKDYSSWDSKGTKLSATTHEMGDANATLTAVFTKASYSVTWGTPLTASETTAAASDLAYDGTPATASVGNGQTLNSGYSADDKVNTGYKITVTEMGGTAKVPLGNADKGTADVAVKVKDGNVVSWKYTMNGHSAYTDDPTSVVVTGDVTFQPVVSTGVAVTYTPGEHGDFDSSITARTRFADITVTPASGSTPAQGYKLADYLFPNTLLENAEATVNANSGNPKGEAGWVFAGWDYKYVSNTGDIVDSASESSLEPLTMDELSTKEELQDLMHSITLTATWKPATSKLAYDFDDAANVEGAGAPVSATFTSAAFTTDPTDTTIGSKVVLPSATDVSRPGFTLSKWEWTEGEGASAVVHKLNPGDSITMPNGLLNDTTTLKAVWTEDTARIDYKPVDSTMGSVAPSSEEVYVWSGKIVGTGAALTGSTATPASSQYSFVNWTNASDEQVGTSTTFTPMRNSKGMYEDATYYATFKGDALKVTFKVGTKTDDQGVISDTNGDEPPTTKESGVLTQTVSFGAKPSMSDLKVTPNNGYEVADGRYWDWVTYTDATKNTQLKHGTTDDPTTVEIKGYTDFTVHFKKTDGNFTVNYDSRGGTSIDPVKRKWTDGNLGANKTPTKTGYTFNGWYTDIPGDTTKATTASDYDQAPGSVKVTTQSFGTLAGNLAADPATTSITLRAGWAEKTGYSVNFDLNYQGSPAVQTTSGISWNGTVPAATYGGSTVPTRSGYVFQGWFNARNGGTAVVADANGSSLGTKYNALAGTDDSATSQTVYAQWAERTYWVKYVDDEGNQVALKDYKLADTGLGSVDKPRDDTDALRWDDWYYRNDSLDKDVKVTGATTVAMLAAATSGYSLEDNSKEKPLVIKGVWKQFYRYDTKVLLFRSLDDVAQNGDAYGLEKPETVVTGWAEKGTKVVLDTSTLPAIPGFSGYNADATKRYLGAADDAALAAELTLDAIDKDYAYEGNGEDGGQLFTVVYLAKADYTVSYDLNDSQAHPGGAIAASVPDGVSLVAKTDPKRTFLDGENTPDGWASDDAATNPTRPGFTFGGWFSTQVPDAEKAIHGVNAMQATKDTPLGDLAYKLVDGALKWYDPTADGGDGNITLFASWDELMREVRYIVAEDMKNFVVIRLNSEEDADYSTAERTEVVGAATGDLFVQGGDGEWTRVEGKYQGAVAKANRGYTFAGWRVIDKAQPSGASYSMPLGAGDPGADLDTMAAASMAAASDEAAVEGAVEAALEVGEGAPMSTMADEDTAKSSEGQAYAGDASITPGTRSDTGLFGGSAVGDESDPTASTVMYMATATQNKSANITFNTDGADKYTGPSRLSQPYGTFVGEMAEGGVWGVNDGSLPDRNAISKNGSVFKGWKTGTPLAYEDENGNVVDIPAGTIIDPGSWMANHLIVPEGGMTLTAVWERGTTNFVVTVPEADNPITGEKVPASTFEVPEGSTMTDEQIAELVNRGGYYPDAWDVSYYEDGKLVTKTMLVDDLIAFLQSTPVTSDMTIAVSPQAKWSKTAPNIPSRDAVVRPAKKSSAAKTGDALVTTASLLVGSAVIAALVLAFLFLRRRRN